MLTPIDGPL